MIRDRHKNIEYFKTYIDSMTASHNRRVKKLKEGQIKPERVIPVKQAMVANLIQKIVAMYSAGMALENLSNECNTVITLIEKSWIEGNRKLIGPKSKVLDQYTVDVHIQLLRLMSIGFLLGKEDSFFKTLAQLIKRDEVVDLVFEFILSSKLNGWEIRQEKATYTFELFSNLKKAIVTENTKKSEELVKIFLDKDWLKEQKKAQILIDTKKDTYYGRWSFESAAVVAIKGLDDSSFRSNEYYPADLADYYKANKSS